MIIYVGNPKISKTTAVTMATETVKLINEFSTVARYKTDIEKFIAFLYIKVKG